MKNELVMDILKKADEHLPGILVVGGVVIGVATVAYSVYAGFKIKEIVSDEELETKEKAKKIAIVSAPAVLGTIASSACEVCAHKEQTKRYAALGTLIAASRAESLVGSDKVEKVKEVVTGKKSEEKSKKVLYPNVEPAKIITIRDCETGFTFQTTMRDFMEKVNEFNTTYINSSHLPTIADFYEMLLGELNYDRCSIHEHIAFGIRYNDQIMPFVPEFDSGMDENMNLIYRINYDYISK